MGIGKVSPLKGWPGITVGSGGVTVPTSGTWGHGSVVGLSVLG